MWIAKFKNVDHHLGILSCCKGIVKEKGETAKQAIMSNDTQSEMC
jgi:hypothetical protein